MLADQILWTPWSTKLQKLIQPRLVKALGWWLPVNPNLTFSWRSSNLQIPRKIQLNNWSVSSCIFTSMNHMICGGFLSHWTSVGILFLSMYFCKMKLKVQAAYLCKTFIYIIQWMTHHCVSVAWLDTPTTTFFPGLVFYWILADLSSWSMKHGALTSQRNRSIRVQKLVVVLEGEWW